MKKIWKLLCVFVLIASANMTTARANGNYDLLYDAFDLLDADYAKELGYETLREISDEYGVEVRIDIMEYHEDYTADEHAEYLIDEYDYGYEDSGNGLYILIRLSQDDDDYVWGDYSVQVYGKDETNLRNAQDSISTLLKQHEISLVFSGDLESDQADLRYVVDSLVSMTRSMLDSSDVTVPAVNNAYEFEYVADIADILSDAEEEALNARCKELTKQYGTGVYIAVVNDYRDYSTRSVEHATQLFYEGYGLGVGDDTSGVILLLSMDDRDYDLMSHGEGYTIFNVDAREYIDDTFLDDFKDNDWYAGFEDYLNGVEYGFQVAQDGTPFETQDIPAVKNAIPLMSMLIGFVISLIVMLIIRRRMKNVRRAMTAGAYIDKDAVNIYHRNDQYVTTNRTSRRIERSSGGGSGSHSSSSGGYGHTSGKF